MLLPTVSLLFILHINAAFLLSFLHFLHMILCCLLYDATLAIYGED